MFCSEEGAVDSEFFVLFGLLVWLESLTRDLFDRDDEGQNHSHPTSV